jgi:hypothetical protein
VADRVRALVGEPRAITVSAGNDEEWEELVEQHRVEKGMR